MATTPDAVISADIVRQITKNGRDGELKFKQRFLNCLATHGVGWEDEGVHQAMFVVNGEGIEYFFMDDGTMELYGGDDTAILVNAINACIPASSSRSSSSSSSSNSKEEDEDPKGVEGGRKKKRKTRATKKRTSRRKLTRRR